MLLVVAGLVTEVHAPEDEHRWLAEYLSFEEERFVAARGRAKKVKPKVSCLYNIFSKSFPSGLVSLVRQAAMQEGFEVTVKDSRVPPFQITALADTDAVWLRDYQRRAVNVALKRTSGILWMSCGAGKTECAVALADTVPVDWLFLVHRKGLLEQAAQRFELRTGEKAGRVGEGKWDVQRFTVATYQTLHRSIREPRARDLLEAAKGVICDECHVVASTTFQDTVMRTPNAYWRVGLSGTPVQRTDRRSMLAVAAIGPVIYRLAPSKLIGDGVLAAPEIRMLEVHQNSTKATWQGVYGECIVRSVTRNKEVVRVAKVARKPCLVFVKELRHGRELATRMAKAGLRVEFAQGKHSSQWRDNLVKSLVRGGTDVLVTTVIMQEGIDIPSLESVVIASGGKSAIAALQRIGRGMRSDGGRKKTFEVWDFSDVGHKWLEKHTKERIKAYQADGYEPEVIRQ